ncbi:protein of unknown function [Rhodovastum atsumiense]|nr:protein of unknown function [Rhodovastum atsumiense]
MICNPFKYISAFIPHYCDNGRYHFIIFCVHLLLRLKCPSESKPSED